MWINKVKWSKNFKIILTEVEFGTEMKVGATTKSPDSKAKRVEN
jgi:hypothetical protein